MAKKIHSWTRYLCPRDGKYNLDYFGFLDVPKSKKNFSIYQPELSVLSDHRNLNCVVILGEPGIGKSTILEEEFEIFKNDPFFQNEMFFYRNLNTFDSKQSLVEGIFKSDEFLECLKSDKVLNLFLDSLDEASLNIKIASQIIGDELARSPVSRINLKISCRTGEWPKYLENILMKLFENKISIFEVAPLSKSDVEIACLDSDLPAKDFIQKVIDKAVAPLSIKPNTLNFLLDIYKENEDFPDTRVELFKKGCELHCRELNISRVSSGHEGVLSVAERLRIASRICALMVFSNKLTIWTSNEICKLDNAISIEDILSEDILSREGNITLTKDKIKEVLNTGLFTARGSELLGFAHQSYGEFLAAYYLKSSQVTLKQLKSLFISKDQFGDHLIPNLNEAAAWMCSLEPNFLDVVLKNDPEVLLSSELSQIEDSIKEKMLIFLIDKVKEFKSTIITDWNLKKKYKSLKFKNISAVLLPYLQNDQEVDEVKNFIIDIVEECGLTDLGDQMVQIALNNKLGLRQRTNAISALSIIGTDMQRIAIKPLLNDEKDSSDELKGWTLKTLRPNLISIDELVASLTPPSRKHFFGAYASFLSLDFKDYLKPEFSLSYLKWARKFIHESESLHRFDSVIDQVIKLAWNLLDDDLILHEFSFLIYERLNEHRSLVDESRERDFIFIFNEDVEKRKKIFLYLLNKIESNDFSKSYHNSFMVLLSKIDLEWILGLFNQISDEEKRLKLAILTRLVTDVAYENNLKLIRESFELIPEIKNQFQWQIGPVELGSKMHQEMKKFYESEKKINKKKEKTNYEKKYSAILSKSFLDLEGDTLNSIFNIVRIVSCDLEMGYIHDEIMDLEDCEGWRFINEERMHLLLSHSKKYLIDLDRDISNSFTENSYDVAVFSGLKLLRFNFKHDQNFLRNQDEAFWEKWTPPLLLYPTWGNYEDGLYHNLLTLAYAKAPSIFKETVLKILVAESKTDSAYILKKVKKFVGQDFAAEILDYCESSNISCKIYINIISDLIGIGIPDVEKKLLSFIHDPLSMEGEAKDFAVYASAKLFNLGSWQYFKTIFEFFEKSYEFGKSVLLSGEISRADINKPKFLSDIPDKDLTDLCAWMLTAFPYGNDWDGGAKFLEPIDHAQRFRSELLQILVSRGSIESCLGVTRLISKFPQYEFLKYSLVEAETRMRNVQWRPPSSHEFLKYIQTPLSRFVSSPEELVECVIECLERFESILHSETPAVTDLWNTEKGRVRPKSEDEFSDRVKRFLVDELTSKGIISNREVEIRIKPQGARTDIHINAVTKNKSGNLDALTLIIECKGSWNDEVFEAMEIQLAKKYLSDSHSKYGIYLVADFFCSIWDQEDDRKSSSRRHACLNNVSKFQSQAAALKNDGYFITPYIMDTRYRKD